MTDTTVDAGQGGFPVRAFAGIGLTSEEFVKICIDHYTHAARAHEVAALECESGGDPESGREHRRFAGHAWTMARQLSQVIGIAAPDAMH